MTVHRGTFENSTDEALLFVFGESPDEKETAFLFDVLSDAGYSFIDTDNRVLKIGVTTRSEEKEGLKYFSKHRILPQTEMETYRTCSI
jgi:hypothetical protein